MGLALLCGRLGTSCRRQASLLPRLTRAFAAERETRVRQPESAAEYEKNLQGAEAGAVSYFTAAWCGPCRAIAPLIDKLSVEFPKVLFLKLDIDNEGLKAVAEQHEVAAVPTFVLHKGEQLLDKFAGADPQRLVLGLHKLS